VRKLYGDAPSGTITRARELRRNATDAEKRLWLALRRDLPAARFRRQVPVSPYFIDFMSFAHRLIVELDGGQHAEAAEYDAARTRFLERKGYRVLRFWNDAVMQNLPGVLEAIQGSLAPRRPDFRAEAEPHPPTRKGAWAPPSPKGEGVLTLLTFPIVYATA
jgi:very-short-patch-repair endonuclease